MRHGIVNRAIRDKSFKPAQVVSCLPGGAIIISSFGRFLHGHSHFIEVVYAGDTGARRAESAVIAAQLVRADDRFPRSLRRHFATWIRSSIFNIPCTRAVEAAARLAREGFLAGLG